MNDRRSNSLTRDGNFLLLFLEILGGGGNPGAPILL